MSGDPSQEELGQVVHRYASKGHPCFGDLALMYGTRREATVRAASPGLLWKLTRAAYQAVARTKVPPDTGGQGGREGQGLTRRGELGAE